jgi:NADH dehydrogenase
MPLNTLQHTAPWKFLPVLRLVAGLPLVYFGVLHLVYPGDFRAILVAGSLPDSDLSVTAVPLVEILAGLLLLAGLWTRLGGMLTLGVMMPAYLVTVQLLERQGAPSMPPLVVLLTVALAAVVLVLLGGGPWSLDERMTPRPVKALEPTGARNRVVILGGGFAGVYTALHLEQLLRGRQDVEVVLVAKENYFVFQPMLTEVISGNVGILDTVNPIRRLVPRTRLYIRDVERIDRGAKTVTLSPGFGDRPTVLSYDHLVVALGNVTDFRQIPGLHDHALPFKYLADALRLRDHLIHVLAEAAIEPDPEERRRLLTFVIGGGGFSGLEVCAELNEFVRLAGKKYYGINPADIQVILVHSQGRVLEREMPESLALYAQRILQGRGLEFLFNKRLSSATPEYAILDDGRHIPTRTLVSTVPSSPNPVVVALEVPKDHGRIKTDLQLRVEGCADLWALGDCALIPNSRGGGFCPPTAQYATREGATCAHNILAVIDGKPLKPFDFALLGMMAALGGRTAIVRMFDRINLHGFCAWVFWRAAYWMKLPGLDRKIRVGISWLLDLLLMPPDLVQTKLDVYHGVAEAHYQPGDLICHEGDTLNRVFIISRGKAQVFRSEGTGAEVPLAQLGPGELFGGLASDGGVQQVGVRCIEEMIVLVLPQKELEPLLAALPDAQQTLNPLRAGSTPRPEFAGKN